MRIEAMLCRVFNIPRAPGPHNPLVAVGLRTVDSGRRGAGTSIYVGLDGPQLLACYHRLQQPTYVGCCSAKGGVHVNIQGYRPFQISYTLHLL